jgi:trans-aconitate 2-methyltransferase
MWDPNQYLKFSKERSRPFLDLLSQVQRTSLAAIADLGCGPGMLTRALAERWPTARVVGVDNSPAMLAQAFQLALPGRLEFVSADLASWTPSGPVDLIVSNAALHWLGDHEALLARFFPMLTPGGTLAVQMPNSFDGPAHQAVEETIATSRWEPLLKGVGCNREHVQPLAWYGQKLLELGFEADAWETTYLHVLSGDNPVLGWLKGTTLRPMLDKLDSAAASDFLGELGEKLRQAYPAQGKVTLFPFRRLFFVATKQM